MTLTLFWSNLAARVTWECHQLAQDLSAFAKREVLHLIPSFLPARGLWSDPTTSLGVVCYFYFVLAGSGAASRAEQKAQIAPAPQRWIYQPSSHSCGSVSMEGTQIYDKFRSFPAKQGSSPGTWDLGVNGFHQTCTAGPRPGA